MSRTFRASAAVAGLTTLCLRLGFEVHGVEVSQFKDQHDTFVLTCYLILMGAPTIFLWYRGYKYGLQPGATWRGAFWRCIAWSVPTCWAILAVRSSHWGALLPLPSWVILPWIILRSTSYTATVLSAAPSPWVSPAVPMVAFFVGILGSRK